MNRPLGDLIVLIIVGTVCAAILLGAGGLAIAEIINPDTDTSASFSALAAVLSSLLAFVAGFMAARTDRRRRENGD